MMLAKIDLGKSSSPQQSSETIVAELLSYAIDHLNSISSTKKRLKECMPEAFDDSGKS